MAREVVYTDDLDGTHGAEPVRFVWDGVEWEIDLAEANRKRLAEALQPFLDKAHPANVAAPKTGSARRRTAGERLDYTTLEHAGRPHRGRITEGEKETVRNNLDKINKRLRDEGQREIDPNDSTMKDRYGL
jgi:hypothetical protein